MKILPRRTIPVVLIVGLFLPLSASLLAPWVGPNIKLGEDPPELPEGTGKNQAEPHVIRSAVNPDLVLATFQEGRFSDGGARTNGYAVSEDGGFTWRRSLNPHLARLNGGVYFRATDPVGAIARDGTLYLNSLAAWDDGFGLAELVVQRSDDQGLTWTFPYSVFLGTSEGPGFRVFPDKNWMVVNDFPDTPTTGRLIVTWTNFRTLVNEVQDIQDFLIMASYSDDQGRTWSAPAFVTPANDTVFSRGQFQGSQPVFLPGGGLAIVFHRFQDSRLEVVYSGDGGATFPFGPTPLHTGYILYDAPNIRDGTFLPSVSVARDTGDLYVAYTSKDSPSGGTGFITFVRSDLENKGLSPPTRPEWRFRPPLKISGTQPLRSVHTPTIAVSPDGQVVTVFFFDNRNDVSGNVLGDFYAVQSIDGGDSWTEPFRITESTFDLRRATNTNRGYMIGDYFGFAAPKGPDQAAIAVWVDTRDPTADPWSARIGGRDGSVFAAWLRANLPHAVHQAGESALRTADSDLDGTPNLLEYIMGQSPWVPEPIPEVAAGVELLQLDPATDPETQVNVTGWSGRWPSQRGPAALFPQESSFGEGFWNRTVWTAANGLRQVRFSINGNEHWHLLESSVPVRWVRSFDNGWEWSPWFGWLFTEAAPWVFHLSLGWLYDAGGGFYAPAFASYVYPDIRTHPWIFRQDGEFLYVLDGSPWVYNTGSANWIRTY